MLGHIITVTLRTWEEKQFYIGEATLPMLQDLAGRMRQTEGGIRAIIRSVPATDEVEFWYRCGIRGLKVQPPHKHAASYNLGLRTRTMKGNK